MDIKVQSVTPRKARSNGAMPAQAQVPGIAPRTRATVPREIAACLAEFDPRYDAHQPSATMLLTDFFAGQLRDLYIAFDGDLHAALVLCEIAQATTRRFSDRSRQDALDLRLLEVGEMREALRPCNAMSVSLACGMPRETVRRKIKQLEARGWIEKVDGGWITAEAAGRRFRPQFNRIAARRVLETAARLLDLLDGR